MKIRDLIIAFASLSLGLLVTLIIRISQVSVGKNISGMVLGGFALLAISIVCLILTWVLKFIFKTFSFWLTLLILLSLGFSIFIFQLFKVY